MPTTRSSTSGRAATRPAARDELRNVATVRLRMLVIGVSSLLLPALSHATDPKPPPPDSEFLEFLGSGDDVDPELSQYLVKKDDPQPDDNKPAPKRADGRT
jgi:hypothetical protein